MADIKFSSLTSPYAVFAYSLARNPDTIYIPQDVREAAQMVFEGKYHLWPEAAQVAGDVFLEEYIPTVLAHESAHLALQRIAREEKLPITKTMDAYHNPIAMRIESRLQNQAAAKALEYLKREKKHGRKFDV